MALPLDVLCANTALLTIDLGNYHSSKQWALHRSLFVTRRACKLPIRTIVRICGPVKSVFRKVIECPEKNLGWDNRWMVIPAHHGIVDTPMPNICCICQQML